MDLMVIFAVLTLLDASALVVLISSWLLIGWRIEHLGAQRPSVSVLMAEYRREWMREMVSRENRIFDAQIVTSLRQSTAFFASTSLLATGAVLALIGNTEALQGVAEGLTTVDLPTLVWQVKLLFVALFLTHAFLKFVWAHRVFGYCSVMMAAVPGDAADPRALPRAMRAAELNIRAAYNFNRGLRSMYFAMGSLAWLLGPLALVLATGVIVLLLWSREFTSVSHDILRGEGPR